MILRSIAVITIVIGAGLQAQDSPAINSIMDDEVDDKTGESARDTASIDAESLRSRIHDMRMNLLLGGDQVRRAETEAVDFYGNKAELIDQRLDTVRADLTEKRASYDIVLDRALNSQKSAEKTKAIGEASVLRAEITQLEAEATNLTAKRSGLAKLIKNVESRDKERERLVAQIETTDDFSQGFGLPMTSIGLAPAVQPVAASSPFDDEALVNDLLKRDLLGARRLLFDADPSSYWRRFPLRPPTNVLKEALEFPLPDLPGER